jgi:hypothetical protein
VKYIAQDAFRYNKALRSLTIPDSIVRIGGEAFKDCPELTTVKMPAHPIEYPRTTAYEQNWAFKGCPKLSLASQTAILDTGYKSEEL